MKNTIEPTGDRLLIEPIAVEEKIGGIWIPENAKEKPAEGIVRAVGKGKPCASMAGGFLPMHAKVGDRVLVSKYGGTEIKIDGVLCKLIQNDDILAIIR